MARRQETFSLLFFALLGVALAQGPASSPKSPPATASAPASTPTIISPAAAPLTPPAASPLTPPSVAPATPASPPAPAVAVPPATPPTSSDDELPSPATGGDDADAPDVAGLAPESGDLPEGPTGAVPADAPAADDQGGAAVTTAANFGVVAAALAGFFIF